MIQNVVSGKAFAADLADRCEVGFGLHDGPPQAPLTQTIETFGTAKVSQEKLYAFKDKLIDRSVRASLKS